MIKKLLLLPLVVMLSGCTNDLSVKRNEKLLSTYYNVYYDYDFSNNCYIVKYDNDNYSTVEIENAYTIYVREYELIDKEKGRYYENNEILDKLLIYNTTKKLYVYRLI